MYTAIVAWITRLTFLMLFVTLWDMCLPTGDLRRYVKLLLGLTVLTALLHPFIALLQGDTYIDALLGSGFHVPQSVAPLEQGAAVSAAARRAVAAALHQEATQAVVLGLQSRLGVDAAQVLIDGAHVVVELNGRPSALLMEKVRDQTAAILQVAAEAVDVQWREVP